MQAGARSLQCGFRLRLHPTRQPNTLTRSTSRTIVYAHSYHYLSTPLAPKLEDVHSGFGMYAEEGTGCFGPHLSTFYNTIGLNL